ncbi:hypothetical protein [Variovorax saccharolyticus]|uniref:hypothetical protein n=1 Tax=Variovorax saccharolyticus TaxID=3053516 RepID=UPI002577FF20|nr:hypothetical protein [Variovorax sp. J22R187]MDM0022156.1 hypothetical protein [Variovorax sp. J22R187]
MRIVTLRGGRAFLAAKFAPPSAACDTLTSSAALMKATGSTVRSRLLHDTLATQLTMTAHDIANGLHAVGHMVGEFGIVGTLAIFVAFLVAVIVIAAWSSLVRWMIAPERSTPIAYIGGVLAAIGAMTLTQLVTGMLEAEGSLKAWFVLASLAYGYCIRLARDRQIVAIALVGLVSAWATGLFVMRDDLSSFNIPYYFAAFSVAGTLLGLLLAKK